MSLVDKYLTKIKPKHHEKAKKLFGIYKPIYDIGEWWIGFIAEITEKDRRKCLRCDVRPPIGCRVYASTHDGYTIAYICQTCMLKDGHNYGKKAHEAVRKNLCTDLNKSCAALHLTANIREEKPLI